MQLVFFASIGGNKNKTVSLSISFLWSREHAGRSITLTFIAETWPVNTDLLLKLGICTYAEICYIVSFQDVSN